MRPAPAAITAEEVLAGVDSGEKDASEFRGHNTYFLIFLIRSAVRFSFFPRGNAEINKEALSANRAVEAKMRDDVYCIQFS